VNHGSPWLVFVHVLRRKQAMVTVRAIYKNGKFEPLQPIVVPDNAMVLLDVWEVQAEKPRPWSTMPDPMFALIGAFTDEQPLIDAIPVSSDPDLYAIAAAMGEEAIGLHAWELAPARYRRGEDGLPVSRLVDKTEE
jgi:hypothetical protein